MKKESATLLALGAAMSGKNLMMCGSGDEAEVLHLGNSAENSERVERIKAESRRKYAEKEARRLARFTGIKR